MTMFPAVTWFEIPVADLDRACRFYETVLGITLERTLCDGSGHPVAMFKLCPQAPEAPSGCLTSGSGVASTAAGITIYLRLDGDLDGALARARQHGGAVVVDVTVLPGDMGRYAVLTDCEGNRIGLHQAAA